MTNQNRNRKTNTTVNKVDRTDSTTAIPSDVNRVAVSITSTLIDRYEGLSTTELVWANVTNGKLVKQMLADEQVKTAVAEFFTNRMIDRVLRRLIKVTMFKPSETAFTKEEFFSALLDVTNDAKVAGAVNELTLPSFIKMGLVSDAIQYSKQVRYGFKRVTVADIRADVTMYSVVEQVKNLNVKIDTNHKMSVTVFAEAVAEALRPVGLAIFEIVDMGGVVDDLVKGVRAHIDPTHAIDSLSGTVPNDWRNHKVVAELATNLVFVRAALALPPGASMALTTDSWKLDKWASVVLTAIKSSEQYQWISRAEALRHYSIRRVRNLRGEPVSAVVARWIEATPVAQSVFAIEDIAMDGAYNISPTRDRIADAVQQAYGKAKFSLLEGADTLKNNLEDYVQAGWTGANSVYVVDAGVAPTSLKDIAVFLADKLYVEVREGKITASAASDVGPVNVGVGAHYDSATYDPAWWYGKDTTELNLTITSGHHYGDRVLTSDPVEVILASADRDAMDVVATRPQMLAAAAFNTRLLTFDESLVMPVNSRFSFDVTVSGQKIMGSFRAIDFASLRSGIHTCLVTPHYNTEVIKALEMTYSRISALNDDVAKSGAKEWRNGKVDSTVISFIRRRQARELLALSQKLDASFRDELHSTLIERAITVGNIAGSEADLFRARLSQKSFAAIADILALRFFLFIQGIDTPHWEELTKSEDVAAVCMEMGSDRTFRH